MTNTRLNHDTHYRALRSRDPRWDGTFFVGVRSTGIYCRPVCRARLPLSRNCTFFDTAAAAELDGYRPCLRCRPELAPGRSRAESSNRLAMAAHARIAAGALNDRSVGDVARELFVGERQLRRAVSAEFGVTPVQLAQTQRLLFAKQLLTDTDLPVTRVAFASGFGSVSRFNSLFRERYGLNPTRLRQGRGSVSRSPGDTVTLTLSYRPPYAWPEMLAFLSARTIAGVERCDATSYTRTLVVDGHAGWIRVRDAGTATALRVTVSDGLFPVLMAVRTAVRRLFDLDAEPELVDAQLRADPCLRGLVRRRPGLRLPGAVEPFELAVRGIVGQQISVAAAHTLCGRLISRYGEPFGEAGADVPDRLPIRADVLAGACPEDVASLGMPLTRARTLVHLAAAVADGSLAFAAGDPAGVVEQLRSIPGIGPWTAEYIAMRGLAWPDAFPASDLGVRKALGGVTTRQATVLAEPWRPWRAYGVIHLWNSLSQSSGRT